MSEKNFYTDDVINVVNQNSRRERERRSENYYRNDSYQRHEERHNNTERFREKSRHGSSSRRTGNKRTINPADKLKRTLAVLAIGAVLVGGPAIVDNAKESAILYDMQDQARAEYIVGNTHRTADNENYWYDYSNIAYQLKDSDNFDKDLYLMDKSSEYFDMNEVLKYTEYGNVENYLEAKNFDSYEQWDEEMQEYVINSAQVDKAFEEREKELNKMKDEINELEEMENEHNLDSNSSYTM